MAPRVGVVGLDLSLRHAAAAYIPPRWKPGEWSKVPVMRAGSDVEGGDPREEVARLHTIAQRVEDFVRRWDEGAVVYVEDYTFGATASRGRAIAEAGGAVKRALYARFDIVVIPVNVSTVRKFFLGKLPKGKGAAQVAVHQALREMGWPHEDSDPGDALLVASYGRTEHGMPGLTVR